MCQEVDGEGGGHNIAAGAMIPEEEKEKFIERLNEEVEALIS
ncbi:MAG: DHH family phosphoesterase [Candidatus Nanohalobium sp.]